MSSAILERSRRCGDPCGSHDTGPVCKSVTNGHYGTDDATYLYRSYPSHTLLPPTRAHPVLDLGQNIGDKEERQVFCRYVFQSFVRAEQREEFDPLRDLPQCLENSA